MFALATAFASAEDAGDLDVGAGFGEGEEAWEEAGFDVGTEEGFHGVVERALEIGEGDVGVDAEAFDLVKDGGVGGIGCVVSVDLAGDDDADGRGLGDHGADLHGAGVGAHQQSIAAGTGLLVGDDESVLRVAGGMVFGEVEGFEVVEVGLDLGAEVGAVAEMVEDGDDLVHGLEEWVGNARGAKGAREGDVDSLHCCGFCCGGGFEGGFDLLFELVEADAKGFFWLRVERILTRLR